MIHPNTELRWISDDKGFGVFATKFIPKGTVTYVADKLDTYIKPNSPLLKDRRYLEIIEKYTFIDAYGTRIMSWDYAKYVNHCCHPNSLTTGWGFEIAIEDIQAGQEITDDYGVFTTSHEMTISCAKKFCRKTLSADAFDHCVPAWDEKIKKALNHYEKVAQPITDLLTKQTLDDLENYVHGNGPYRSVAEQKPNSKLSPDVVDIRDAKSYISVSETGG